MGADDRKQLGAGDGRLVELTWEQSARVTGLARIGVEPSTAPFNYRDFKRLSGIERGIARSLERYAKGAGADVRSWWVSFEPVPRERWMSVQVLHGAH